MAKVVEAFRDDRGTLHNTPASAVVADIAAALGRVGEEGGLTNGVAALILEKRKDIEKAFADLDMLNEQRGEQPVPAPRRPEPKRGEVVEHPAKRSEVG